ncbi:MAG: glycoside hydrolase [Candidatus Symbiothrix sp.]|nr:glycoside hydrolase [Candidatus Symbiothrix sp.]
MKHIILIFSCFIFGLTLFAQEINLRISWDKNSYQELTSYPIAGTSTVARTAYYPRIKRLGDNSLLMVFMNSQLGYSIYTRRSIDEGKTWSEATIVRKTYKEASPTSANDNRMFACPDFIELGKGEILLAYQWRYSNAYSSAEYTNVSCGIETMRSRDYGNTWETPRKVYNGRMWEPSFILLPSGELQMLFTDSHEVNAAVASQPAVSMLRSFDKGETWQNKALCSWQDAEVLSRIVDNKGTYDGMPVGKVLHNNNGIAYACESYGYAQAPWIVWSSMEKNWEYNDFYFATGGPGSNRRWLVHPDFKGAAPYMEVLPTGEVIVQGNGSYKSSSGMWAFIGTPDAKTFSFASSPYSGWWGAISYIGNDEVISTANQTYKLGSLEYEMLKVIKGKLNYAKDVYKSSIELQSLSSFDRSIHHDWFIGEKSQSQAFVNFGYSDTHFEYTVHLFDSIITAFTPTNADAVVLRMNRKTGDSNVLYQIAVNAAGKFSLDKKTAYTWIPQDVSSVNEITVQLDGSINDASDKDTGYAAKVHIPWNLLGGLPSDDEIFSIHLMQRYKDTVTEAPAAVLASIAGEQADDPTTWLKINFLSNETGIRKNNRVENPVFVSGKSIKTAQPEQMSSIDIYNLAGQKILHLSSIQAEQAVDLPQGCYLLVCKDITGKTTTLKQIFR